MIKYFSERNLYPSIDPFDSGFLQVDKTHKIYWEQSGNPDGFPILFLHGGQELDVQTKSGNFLIQFIEK